MFSARKGWSAARADALRTIAETRAGVRGCPFAAVPARFALRVVGLADLEARRSSASPCPERVRSAAVLSRSNTDHETRPKCSVTQPRADALRLGTTALWRQCRVGPLVEHQAQRGLTSSVLGCVHLPPVYEPPARIVFNLSPVRQLVITNDEEGVRLFLRLAAAPTEDIMVFGQEPRSAGRNKRRNVSYLGLLPPPVDGLSEITNLYKARYGEPRPGRKVFVVTCQQKNGWEGLDQEASEVVPDRPAGQQVMSEAAVRGVPLPVAASLQGAAALAETGSSQKPLMHKGCTRGAIGFATPVVNLPQEGAHTAVQSGKAAVATFGESGGAGRGSGGPG